MSPEIFITDFERTENTDFLHGALGRTLILATRFDNMCNSMALAIEIDKARTFSYISENSFEALVEAATSRYRTLSKNIDFLGMPEQINNTLHAARKARNEVAHSLTIGLTGCLDAKISNNTVLEDVVRLVGDLALGDIIASLLISTFNNDPIPNKEFIDSYKAKIIDWAIHDYNP